MSSIEIPLPDIKISHEYGDYDWRTDEDMEVFLSLTVGVYKVVTKRYVIPVSDYDNRELDDAKDNFCKYVAERLSGLFEDDL